MKEPQHLCTFIVTIYRNGHLMLTGESQDRDAVVDLLDAINQNRIMQNMGYGASCITRGSGGVQLQKPLNIAA